MCFGSFDILNVGHINLLNVANSFVDHLVVYVSSDKLNSYKNKQTIIQEQDRVITVSSLKMVDSVFIEDSMDAKAQYIDDICEKYEVEYDDIILFKGPDWELDYYESIIGVVQIETVPRTDGISSSDIRNKVIDLHKKGIL